MKLCVRLCIADLHVTESSELTGSFLNDLQEAVPKEKKFRSSCLYLKIAHRVQLLDLNAIEISLDSNALKHPGERSVNYYYFSVITIMTEQIHMYQF